MIQIDKQAVYKYNGYVFQHFSILSEELLKPVSYTHLDVYKRQLLYSEILRLEKAFFKRSFNERKDNVYF